MNMDKQPKNNSLLREYLSFAWQLIAGIAIFVYVGMLADRWIKTKTPLLVWIFPLLVIIGMMIKVIRDTTNKKDDKA